MERKIKIEECGQLTVVEGDGAGKPVLCHHVNRLCYAHCAAFTSATPFVESLPTLSCYANGRDLPIYIGVLEVSE